MTHFRIYARGMVAKLGEDGGLGSEWRGDSSSGSAQLLLGRVLARRSCARGAAGSRWAGGAGPARSHRSELGRAGFVPGQPRVQQLPGAADATCWCQTLPSGTGFEAASASLVSCAVPAHHG